MAEHFAAGALRGVKREAPALPLLAPTSRSGAGGSQRSEFSLPLWPARRILSYAFAIIALPLRKCWIKPADHTLQQDLVFNLFECTPQTVIDRNSPSSSYNSLRKRPFGVAQRRQINLVQ
jgi:hypothetical protein